MRQAAAEDGGVRRLLHLAFSWAEPACVRRAHNVHMAELQSGTLAGWEQMLVMAALTLNAATAGPLFVEHKQSRPRGGSCSLQAKSPGTASAVPESQGGFALMGSKLGRHKHSATRGRVFDHSACSSSYWCVGLAARWDQTSNASLSSDLKLSKAAEHTCPDGTQMAGGQLGRRDLSTCRTHIAFQGLQSVRAADAPTSRMMTSTANLCHRPLCYATLRHIGRSHGNTVVLVIVIGRQQAEHIKRNDMPRKLQITLHG